MANFTTGTIDLSANNTFDNVIMGAGDVMNFSNAGTGGAAGAPIVVTGNFTMTGGTITLRRANLSPGSVTAGGITKNLNTVPGQNGNGGQGGRAGGQFVFAMGGSGGQGGSEGNDAYYYNGTVYPKANSHGAYPGGAGNTVDTYGGGGGGGKTGESNEAVCFYVLGNVSITGGTIQGAGENGGNGGPGGNGNGSPAGGGGGGGAGGSGGRLLIIHVGTQTESSVTKSLAAGTGGGGGAKGTGYYDNYDATAGSAGTAGTAGYVEYTKADAVPEIGALSITGMFENQINGGCSVVNNGGHDISEMGFVTGANADPTTADTKHTVANIQSGAFVRTITGLTASTHYHIRAFATNSKGTVYSNDLSFTTLEAYFSRMHLCS